MVWLLKFQLGCQEQTQLSPVDQQSLLEYEHGIEEIVILSLGNCLCRVLHDISMTMLISFGFSGFFHGKCDGLEIHP